MGRSLYAAAREGDVEYLVRLAEGEDPLLLDRWMVTSYNRETLLHVSAMLGLEEFTKVLLKLKPELAGELNSDGSSALHLAAAKGYVGIVKLLVSVNTDMCLKRDCKGLTPLHVAALKGHKDVMIELLRAKADAARAPVDARGGATVLHLCVWHNRMDAVVNNSVEMITYLVNNKSINLNKVNGNGNTALDIVEQSGPAASVGEHLRSAGAVRANTN